MNQSRVRTSIRLGTIVAGSLLLLVVLLPAADAQDSQATSINPCPGYSIQDIFNDPSSDWDRDRVPNATELEFGENPCVPVTSSFCDQQPTLCTFTYLPVSSVCSAGTYWSMADVDADPTSDWDRDGITNLDEAENGANPCSHPCPRPTTIDFTLGPSKDWDNDGVSNRAEAFNGTDPCRPNRGTVYYVVSPSVPLVAPVVTPTTPPPGFTCPAGFPYYNGTTRLCHRVPQFVVRPAPVVSPATPPRGYTCPSGYPYYNPTTRLCYQYTQPVLRPAPVISQTTPPPGFICPSGFPYYNPTTRLCHALRF